MKHIITLSTRDLEKSVEHGGIANQNCENENN